MKRHICLLVIIVTAGSPDLSAQSRPHQPKWSSPKPARLLREELMAPYEGLSDMVRFLRLVPEQTEKLAELLERHQEARQALEETHAQKRAEIEVERKLIEDQVTKPEDLQTVFRDSLEQLRAREKALDQERRDLRALHQAEVDAFFSPDQRYAWEKHRLVYDAMRRFYGARLSDEQKAKIEKLCTGALAEINALTGDPREVHRQQRTIEDQLIRKIRDEVLTEENRLDVEAASLASRVSADPLRRCKLGSDQMDKLRALARPYAVELRKVGRRQYAAAFDKAVAELAGKAVDTILSDAQKSLYVPSKSTP